MGKKEKKTSDEKPLYVWAESVFFDDEVWPFLSYCRDYFYDPSDRVTYEEFQKLRNGFER